MTVGEKELVGPGRTAFSVGAGAFVGVAGALEPGDFDGSAGFSFSVLHDASAPIPTTATAPVTKAIRLVKRVDNIVFPHFLYPIIRAQALQLYARARCSIFPHRRRLPAYPAGGTR